MNISSDEFQTNRRNTIGFGVGGTGRNVGGGISVGIPIGKAHINRKLIFDFIDVKKDVLFWQAISESNFNPNASPEKREEKLRKIVAKAFSKYPPEK